MTLAEELTFMLQEMPVRRRVWLDAPAKTLGDEHWRLRLHGIVEEIAMLESELALRRARDAEIAKRLRQGLIHAVPELLESWSKDHEDYYFYDYQVVRNVIADLEAGVPTPAPSVNR